MSDEVDKINEAHRKSVEDKNKSSIMPGLDISHELLQEKEERERQEKETKAKALIDSIQVDLKQYIDTQMAAIPSLINNTINQAFQQIAPQLQQQAAAPPQGTDADKMAMLGQLAPVIASIFGKGEQQGSSISDQLMGMIINGHMKKMQMDIDSQYMSTYQQPVPPPQWQNQNVPNPNNQRFE